MKDDSDGESSSSFLLQLTTHTWLNLTLKDSTEEIKSNEKRLFLTETYTQFSLEKKKEVFFPNRRQVD